MKVLYIAVGKGGSDKSLLSLLLELLKKGVEPLVLIAKSKSELEGELEEQGIRCVSLSLEFNTYPNKLSFKKRIKYPINLFRKNIKRNLAFKKVMTLCEEFKPDIIHTNVSVFDVGYQVSKELGIPHIWHLREYVDKDFNFEMIPSMEHFREQLANLNNNYTIAISDDIRYHNKLTTLSNSLVVYNGLVSNGDIQPVKPKEEYFLFVGALMEHKGIFDLIEGYALYRKNNPSSKFRLKLTAKIRYSKEEEKMHAMIRDNNLSDWIDLLGFTNNVSSVMSRAKAVIIPSLHEGFGRVMVEAMSAGTAVIGRNTGGLKLQFDNGLELTKKEIGYRFNTVNEMSEALEKVSLLEDEEYNQVISDSQMTIKHYYSIESSANSVYSLYEKIIKSNVK